ncbi:MAG: Hsp70 family protein [Thermoguttaceae bacterium]|nr:Hsp70 family protein [Thermoguttaceae bacterium]
MNKILGIDFGTSNTTLAFWSDQKNAPEVIRAKNGEEKIPSLVYLGTPRQYGHAVSEILKNAQFESEEQQKKTSRLIIREIKMELMDNISFLACDGSDVSACEIVRDFLSYLKQYAEEVQFYSPVEELHISHPVIDSNAFTETARKRLEEAAYDAGFAKVELIEEPVAAAYGYIAQGSDVGENVLVYDIGGGTLDLAYLSRDYKGVYRPVKTSSVPNCAGSDFDRLIYKYVASKIPELEYDEKHLSFDVLTACKNCKETLSSVEKSYWKGPRAVQFTRSEFENLIRSKIQESLKAAEDIFTNLQAEGKTIDTFLLIGGSSRIPLIHEEFNRLYEEKRISCKPLATQIKDIAVALGTVCDPEKLQTLQLQRKEQELSKTASTNTVNQESGADTNNAPSTSTSEWTVGKPKTVDLFEDF